MTSEAAGLAPPLPWKPRLQMSSLHTLAADLSGLWALANKALDDPRRAGRVRGLVWLLVDLAPGNGPSGQKECFSCAFLSHGEWFRNAHGLAYQASGLAFCQTNQERGRFSQEGC